MPRPEMGCDFVPCVVFKSHVNQRWQRRLVGNKAACRIARIAARIQWRRLVSCDTTPRQRRRDCGAGSSKLLLEERVVALAAGDLAATSKLVAPVVHLLAHIKPPGELAEAVGEGRRRVGPRELLALLLGGAEARDIAQRVLREARALRVRRLGPAEEHSDDRIARLKQRLQHARLGGKVVRGGQRVVAHHVVLGRREQRAHHQRRHRRRQDKLLRDADEAQVGDHREDQLLLENIAPAVENVRELRDIEAGRAEVAHVRQQRRHLLRAGQQLRNLVRAPDPGGGR
mmetsp:Transcript_738/g.1517  ORF Transcript_738/g.1517 Transcript_738/m.1517 type:complete len:286 (+) Transcript_738:517-1374(+)